VVKTREIDVEALENAVNIRAEFIRVETLFDGTRVNELKTEFPAVDGRRSTIGLTSSAEQAASESKVFTL
jgi:hypothetical protein